MSKEILIETEICLHIKCMLLYGRNAECDVMTRRCHLIGHCHLQVFLKEADQIDSVTASHEAFLEFVDLGVSSFMCSMCSFMCSFMCSLCSLCSFMCSVCSFMCSMCSFMCSMCSFMCSFMCSYMCSMCSFMCSMCSFMCSV